MFPYRRRCRCRVHVFAITSMITFGLLMYEWTAMNIRFDSISLELDNNVPPLWPRDGPNRFHLDLSSESDAGDNTGVGQLRNDISDNIIKEVGPAGAREDSRTFEDERTTTGCVKTLHIFSEMELLRHVDELKHFVRMFYASNETAFATDLDCLPEGYDCTLRMSLGADVSMIPGKDAVVFSMVGTQWRRNTLLDQVFELKPEPGQTWIYYSTESPLRVVRWSESMNITRLPYHVLMTYDADADIPIPFGYYRPFNESELNSTTASATGGLKTDESFFNRTGLISWVASNCRDVFWPRMDIVARLRELLPLDDYGTCGHMECLPKRSDYCNRVFASYKFYLAIPNSECNDYITEKFWSHSLKYGIVPVIMGARKADYDRVAPPNSFIHAADFDSMEDLADYILKVDRDDELYRSYHEWRSKGEVVITFPITPRTFCDALPHMHARKADDAKLVGDSPWYNGCRTLPDRGTWKKVYRELGNWAPWR